MDTVSNPRTKSSIGHSLAFSGFLLITFKSMIYAQEYGYRLAEDSVAAVWWAEGAYKVMKDDLYWFDEPDPENYPFVREGMMTIRGQDYAKDPQAHRRRMGEVLEKLLAR